jgi:hypothetical protein
MNTISLGDLFSRTRTLLNDDEATNWPDYRLRPKAVIAFEDLEAELTLAGIPIINTASAILQVPAMTLDDINLDLSTVLNYPNDLLLPIWIKERQLGQQNRDFVDMVECDFIPNVVIGSTLNYWSWNQNTILVRGCMNEVEVQIRYKRLLLIPSINTDSIIVPLGQLYLSYRIASLASPNDAFDKMAIYNLDRIIRINIKQLQNTPAKRRPYHRGHDTNRTLRDY